MAITKTVTTRVAYETPKFQVEHKEGDLQANLSFKGDNTLNLAQITELRNMLSQVITEWV